MSDLRTPPEAAPSSSPNSRSGGDSVTLIEGQKLEAGDASGVVVDVAVLFADPKGAYAGLPGVDLWDEARDARLYTGPWPVVAHPPCARWSRLAGFTQARFGLKRGADGGCFESALSSVRSFGGVIEHPAFSDAWRAFDLPRPITAWGWTAGMCGGWSCYVEQGRYGLPVKKATWLYAYGVDLPDLRWGHEPDSNGQEPNGEHGGLDNWRDRFGGRRAQWEEARGSVINAEGVRCRPSHLGQTSTTPEAFRDVLIGMARTSTTRPLAAPKSSPLPVSASSVEARRPENQDLGDVQSPSSGGGQ